MCPGTCAEFLCADCRKAAQDDKRAAFDAEQRIATLTADVEAHRLRCAELEKQLETWKREGMKSDARAKVAEERLVAAMAGLRELRGLALARRRPLFLQSAEQALAAIEAVKP